MVGARARLDPTRPAGDLVEISLDAAQRAVGVVEVGIVSATPPRAPRVWLAADPQAAPSAVPRKSCGNGPGDLGSCSGAVC